MTTLARHRDPAGGRPHEAGDADAGAGPEHDLGAVGDRFAATDLDQILRPKVGQRQRQRLEIVEDVQLLEPGRAAERVAGEGPRGIDESDILAGHRRGHGEGAVGRRLFQTGDIGGGSAGDGRMVGAKDLADVRELERIERGHGEAGIGAADVGDDGAGCGHGALPVAVEANGSRATYRISFAAASRQLTSVRTPPPTRAPREPCVPADPPSNRG
jgi:hypothetical protein